MTVDNFWWHEQRKPEQALAKHNAEMKALFPYEPRLYDTVIGVKEYNYPTCRTCTWHLSDGGCVNGNVNHVANGSYVSMDKTNDPYGQFRGGYIVWHKTPDDYTCKRHFPVKNAT